MKNAATPYGSLLAAARADAPTAATKAKLWSAVSQTVGAPAATSAAVGTGSAAKTLLYGALLGGTVTVGLASALLFVRVDYGAGHDGSGRVAPPRCADRTAMVQPPSAASKADAHPGARSPAVRPAAPLDSTAPYGWAPAKGRPITALAGPGAAADRTDSPANQATSTAPRGASPANPRSIAVGRAAAERPPTWRSGAPPSSEPVLRQREDALTREAALLARARTALARRDAAATLTLVRAAAAIPGRQLVPEELAIEGQALRALGRTDEADALGIGLRALYPESALGR